MRTVASRLFRASALLAVLRKPAHNPGSCTAVVRPIPHPGSNFLATTSSVDSDGSCASHHTLNVRLPIAVRKGEHHRIVTSAW